MFFGVFLVFFKLLKPLKMFPYRSNLKCNMTRKSLWFSNCAYYTLYFWTFFDIFAR